MPRKQDENQMVRMMVVPRHGAMVMFSTTHACDEVIPAISG